MSSVLIDPGARAVTLTGFPMIKSVILAISILSPAMAAAAPNIEQAVDQLFADYAKPGAPGCALGVIRDGKLIYEKGYGLASLEHGIPIDPQQTVFNIGSTSKQFTAMAIMLLVAEGKLALDDDLRKLLPEMPDYGQAISVRELLHHTSGLRDYTVLMTMGTGIHEIDYQSADDAMAMIRRQRGLNFAPGSHFMYSNSNYFLLAQIVERVSQRPFAQFMKERIFEPLGMRRTRVGAQFDAVVPHLASAYKPDPNGGFALHMTNWEHVGESRIFSTIGDLAKWDRNFYAPVVGSAAMIGQLQQNGKRRDGVVLDYAMGLFVDKFGQQRAIHHAGNTAAYGAQLFRLPEQGFSVALLCNISTAEVDNLARRTTHLYLGDKLVFRPGPGVPERPAAPSVPVMKNIAGTYVERFNQSIRRVEETDGKLWYVRSERSRTQLHPGLTHYALDASAATVSFAPAARQMRFHPVDGEPSEFDKVDAALPKPAELKNYMGAFRSDEIGTTWTVLLKDGKLVMETPRAPDLPMVPLFADGFRAGTELIRFQRDRAGRVVGLKASNIRVLGLNFEKLRPGAPALTARRRQDAR